jgi:peroxiredoxin
MMQRRTFVGLGAGAVLGSVELMGQIKTPKPAPELVITLNGGEQVLLSKFKGKVVVLEFLLTTCSHCQACSAVMQKLSNEMGDKFQPLGTAINPQNMTQARMMIPQYVASVGLKFPVGWTKSDMAYQWLGAENSNGPIYFPQLAFIDRKGVIRHHFPGGHDFYRDEEANMRTMILALANEGAVRPAGKKG